MVYTRPGRRHEARGSDHRILRRRRKRCSVESSTPKPNRIDESL
jgi:hypothetical protein